MEDIVRLRSNMLHYVAVLRFRHLSNKRMDLGALQLWSAYQYFHRLNEPKPSLFIGPPICPLSVIGSISDPGKIKNFVSSWLENRCGVGRVRTLQRLNSIPAQLLEPADFVANVHLFYCEINEDGEDLKATAYSWRNLTEVKSSAPAWIRAVIDAAILALPSDQR